MTKRRVDTPRTEDAAKEPEVAEEADLEPGVPPEALEAALPDAGDVGEVDVGSKLVAVEDRALARYDPLQAYLSEVRRYPLLTPEQEHEAAVRYVKDGDVAAAARLVTANLRLVVKIAHEYRRAYKNILDLIQEGNIGLMQAVKKYDPYRGVKLSSYAAWWIRAYIIRFILNNWRMVKIGTTQAQRMLFFNLNREKSRLAALGIEPTSERVASSLGVESREVEEMDMRLRATDFSLDTPLTDPSGGRTTTRLDMTPSPGTRADDALALSEFNSDLAEHLAAFGAALEGKEKFIFDKRLMTDAPMKLQEIGEHFGVSRERVRQIEKRLLDRLRDYLLRNMGEHFDIRPEQ